MGGWGVSGCRYRADHFGGELARTQRAAEIAGAVRGIGQHGIDRPLDQGRRLDVAQIKELLMKLPEVREVVRA